MPLPRKQALRIVVQHLGDPERYRLIAYGDGAVYRPLEFASRDAILNALRHLLPEIEENVLAAQDKTGISRIVFTADVDIAESQLREAGFTSEP